MVGAPKAVTSTLEATSPLQLQAGAEGRDYVLGDRSFQLAYIIRAKSHPFHKR
jgi:hypothetical protein